MKLTKQEIDVLKQQVNVKKQANLDAKKLREKKSVAAAERVLKRVHKGTHVVENDTFIHVRLVWGVLDNLDYGVFSDVLCQNGLRVVETIDFGWAFEAVLDVIDE